MHKEKCLQLPPVIGTPNMRQPYMHTHERNYTPRFMCIKPYKNCLQAYASQQ